METQQIRFYLLLTTIVTCLSGTLKGQLIFLDSGRKSDSTELLDMFESYKVIRDSLNKNRFEFTLSHILETGDRKYLMPEGHFNVYLWQNGNWENIYNGNYFGYNFKSKKFVLNNNIYSYGGYGFWQWHGQIIQFNLVSGGWDLVNFAQTPKNEWAYLTDGGLCILGDSIRIVNFDHQKIITRNNKTPSLRFSEDRNKLGIESENFYLADSHPMWIVKKETEEFRKLPMVTEKYFTDSFQNPLHMVVIKNDTIISYYNNPERRDTLALADIFLTSEIYSVNNHFISSKLYFLGAALLLTCIGGFFILSRKKRETAPKTEDFDTRWVQVLESTLQKSVSPHELDVLLEIHHIKPQESLRYRRSQMIKRINKLYKKSKGKDLIVRIKDPEDGRKYHYRIENV